MLQTAILLAALGLSGCAPAGARTGPAAPSPDSDLARLHPYEVAPEQILRPAAADTGVIQVVGTGTARVAPNTARVIFSVETRGKTAGEVVEANARTMTAVLSALREGGLEGLELSTRGYALNPLYTLRTGDGASRQVIDGYQARNHVVATLSDMDAVGRAIDLAVGAGANGISSLTFIASDTEEARLRALEEAVRAATAEARTIAAALGRELGPPLEVRGGSQQPSPPSTRDFAMMADARSRPTTPVEVGEQTVRATVNIRFALGGRR